MDDDLDLSVERVVAAARRPVRLDPAFDDRVMAAVRQSSPRPAGIPRRLAIAAGIAALMLGSAWLGRRTAPGGDHSGTPVPVTAAAERVVEFVVLAPGAGQVTLAGDFNEWSTSATPLAAADEAGVWSVTLPLSAGRYEYAFIVDGERWLPDPSTPRAHRGDFGVPNSVITVTGRT